MSVIIDGSASVTINSGTVLGITSGTAVASTSGTSIDFTGLPAWVKRVTVMFNGVSTSGTSVVLVQLGAGSVQSSGYLGSGFGALNVFSPAIVNYTTGFGVGSDGAATYVRQGLVTLCLVGSNSWVSSGWLSQSDAARVQATAGSVTLGGTLDRVRITTVNGTDTFDAGAINILYEG